MVTKEVIVKNSTGLHARPATLLVKSFSFQIRHKLRVQWKKLMLRA